MDSAVGLDDGILTIAAAAIVIGLYFLLKPRSVSPRNVVPKSTDSGLSYPKVDPKYARERVGDTHSSRTNESGRAPHPRPASAAADYLKPETNSSSTVPHQSALDPSTTPYPRMSHEFRKEHILQNSLTIDVLNAVKARRRQQKPEAAVPSQAKSQRSVGSIYLLATGHGLVKIGITTGSANTRMKSYVKQHRLAGSFYVVREWQALTNYRAIESEIHRKLVHRRVRHDMRELYVMQTHEAMEAVERILSAHISAAELNSARK